MKFTPLWGLMALLLAATASSASAEPSPRRSVSYSTWLLEGDLVTARLVLPAADAAALVGRAMPLLSTESVARYVLSHVSVTAAGSPCEATEQGYDIGKIDSLSLGPGLYGFEIIFRCPVAGGLALDNAVLFAESPQHVDFARIERGGMHASQMFTAAHHVLQIASTGGLPAAGADRYLELGASHAWRSAPWLCAMLGFFMLARDRRRLASVLAALAAGYAAAILVTAGGLQPDAGSLDAGMGFVVACIAALLVAQSLRRGTSATAGVAIAPGVAGGGSVTIAMLPALTAMLAALAGLIEGLVLPEDYERVGQWSELSLRNLGAFAMGAWLTGALMLTAFAVLAKLIAGRRGYRVRRETFAPLAGEIAASVLAGWGSFWLLSRLH